MSIRGVTKGMGKIAISNPQRAQSDTVKQVLNSVIDWDTTGQVVENAAVRLGENSKTAAELEKWFYGMDDAVRNTDIQDLTEADMYSWIMNGAVIMNKVSNDFHEIEKKIEGYYRSGQIDAEKRKQYLDNLANAVLTLFGCPGAENILGVFPVSGQIDTTQWFLNLMSLLPKNLEQNSQKKMNNIMISIRNDCLDYRMKKVKG